MIKIIYGITGRINWLSVLGVGAAAGHLQRNFVPCSQMWSQLKHKDSQHSSPKIFFLPIILHLYNHFKCCSILLYIRTDFGKSISCKLAHRNIEIKWKRRASNILQHHENQSFQSAGTTVYKFSRLILTCSLFFNAFWRIKTCTLTTRHTTEADNYPNPRRCAERALRSKRRMLCLVFQRAWITTDGRRSSKMRLCVPAAHSVCFPKSSPARVQCVPQRQQKTAASTRRWRKRKKKGESQRIRKGGKNVGYARLIFRASEECAEAPLVSPFTASVPMKRDGEVVGLGFFLRSFS